MQKEKRKSNGNPINSNITSKTPKISDNLSITVNSKNTINSTKKSTKSNKDAANRKTPTPDTFPMSPLNPYKRDSFIYGMSSTSSSALGPMPSAENTIDFLSLKSLSELEEDMEEEKKKMLPQSTKSYTLSKFSKIRSHDNKSPVYNTSLNFVKNNNKNTTNTTNTKNSSFQKINKKIFNLHYPQSSASLNSLVPKSVETYSNLYTKNSDKKNVKLNTNPNYFQDINKKIFKSHYPESTISSNDVLSSKSIESHTNMYDKKKTNTNSSGQSLKKNSQTNNNTKYKNNNSIGGGLNIQTNTNTLIFNEKTIVKSEQDKMVYKVTFESEKYKKPVSIYFKIYIYDLVEYIEKQDSIDNVITKGMPKKDIDINTITAGIYEGVFYKYFNTVAKENKKINIVKDIGLGFIDINNTNELIHPIDNTTFEYNLWDLLGDKISKQFAYEKIKIYKEKLTKTKVYNSKVEQNIKLLKEKLLLNTDKTKTNNEVKYWENKNTLAINKIEEYEEFIKNYKFDKEEYAYVFHATFAHEDLITFRDYIYNIGTKEENKTLISNAVEMLNEAYTEYNFIHCDLHHGNILVDPKNINKIYLFDFDLSEIGGKNKLPKLCNNTENAYLDALALIFFMFDAPDDTHDALYKPPGVSFINTQAQIDVHCSPLWLSIFHSYDIYRLTIEPTKYNMLLEKNNKKFTDLLTNYFDINEMFESTSHFNKIYHTKRHLTQEILIDFFENSIYKSSFFRGMMFGIAESNNIIFNYIKKPSLSLIKPNITEELFSRQTSKSNTRKNSNSYSNSNSNVPNSNSYTKNTTTNTKKNNAINKYNKKPNTTEYKNNTNKKYTLTESTTTSNVTSGIYNSSNTKNKKNKKNNIINTNPKTKKQKTNINSKNTK